MELVIESDVDQFRYCDLIWASGVDPIPVVEDFMVTAVRDGWMSRFFLPDFTRPTGWWGVMQGEKKEATSEELVDPGVREASADILTKVRHDRGDRSWVDADVPHLLGQRQQEASAATVDGHDPHRRISETSTHGRGLGMSMFILALVRHPGDRFQGPPQMI